MALSISAGTVLANLLFGRNEDDGVSFKEINEYCNKVRQFLFDAGYKYVYFAITDDVMSSYIRTYNVAFKEFRGKYYLKPIEGYIDLDFFNKGYGETVDKIFRIAAEEMKVKRKEGCYE